MKLLSLLGNKKPVLGEQGIAHLFTPLLGIFIVAVVGTFMVVSGSASPISAKNAAAVTPKGYLIIRGDENYTGAQIVARNMDVKTKKCNSSWNTRGGGATITRKFPGAKVVGDSWQFKPVVLTCAATSGGEAYEINYMKGKTVIATAIAVDVDAGYCTDVYPDGSQIKRKVDKKKFACGNFNTKKITRVTPSIVMQPSSSPNGKNITGWVSLVAPSITKRQCTGQVKVTVSGPALVATKNFPLKYVNAKNLSPYCVAKLNFTRLKQNENYNVKAEFGGSWFFYPGVNEANVTLLSKAKTQRKGTGGAAAPAKVEVVVRSLPEFSNGKKITGFVEVTSAGGLTKRQCSGSTQLVVTTFNKGTNKTTVKKSSAPLKYVAAGSGYCAARISVPVPSKRRADLAVNVSAAITATHKYLNAANANKTVTVPANVSRTGGALAPAN